MLRNAILSVALLGCCAGVILALEPLAFDEPFDLAKEYGKIFDRYQSRLVGETSSPAYKAAWAEKKEALSQLVAAAEKAHSPNRLLLAFLYQALERFDDAARVDEQILQATPRDLSTHAALLTSLVAVKKWDALEAACRRLLAIEPKGDEAVQYLGKCPAALKEAILALQGADKRLTAKELAERWKTQLDAVRAELLSLPPEKRIGISMESAEPYYQGLLSRICG